MTTDVSVVKEVLHRYSKDPTSLIMVLQDIQASLNYIPEDVINMVSKELSVPRSRIYSVASFYKSLSLVERGKHQIDVCMGTACHVRGAGLLVDQLSRELGIKSGETSEDKEFTLNTVNCVGACAMGPVVVMDGDRVSKLVEKPSTPISKLAIVGVYYFANGRKLMNYCRELKEKNIKTRGEYQLTDAMQLMLQNGEPFGILDIDGWYDCGKPETLLETNRELLNRNGSSGTPILENSTVIPPCSFGSNTVIRNSVVGPWFSGGDSVVIENSRISNTIAGAESKFQHIIITESVTGERSEISSSPAKFYIGDDSVVET